RPRHLSPDYAAQFADDEVAAVYHHRPPYPPETFAIIAPLLGPRPRTVLELGAGTGDLTIGLAPHPDRVVAIEPARPMLGRGRGRGMQGHVEWLAMAAEDHAYDRRYTAAVAAEAFHWLDWHRVLPRLAKSLAPEGRLILVERAPAGPLPWDAEVSVLI